MRLWTFQSPEVFNELMTTGVYHTNHELSNFNFAAYDWMKEQMEERLPACENAEYPIWAWYKWDGKNVKPDLRRSEFKSGSDAYLFEIEIPDDEVLLSDFDNWSCIIADSPISDDEDLINWYFDEATPEEQESCKKENWPLVFDTENSDMVQACFWELKLEQVKDIRFCRACAHYKDLEEL